MLDTQDDVKKLNQGRLSIATATVLAVGVETTPCVEEDAIGKPSLSHVLASRQKGSNAVVENVRVTIFVHLL